MREYLTVFLVSLAVTYLLCVVAREIAHRTGAEAQVRQRDMHEVPVPYFGGMAMLGGIAASVLLASHLPFLSIANVDQGFDDAWTVVQAGALICLLGVLDDLFELDAVVKLLGQVLAAGYLVVNGVYFYWAPLPGDGIFALTPDLSALLTVVLVVGTVNAVNFIDGLDGLATGIIGIGAVAFLCFSYVMADVNGQSLAVTAALLCAALAGACMGFLPHNIWPARMFMGDSGSMLIGLVLAASALTLTGQFPTGSLTAGADGAASSLAPVILPLVLPLAILIVPFADLALAVVRRTRAGRSPFSPDKQHLHHRMVEIGHSHRRAVAILWVWAAAIAFGAVLISLRRDEIAYLALGVGVLFAVLMTFVLPIVQPPHLGRAEEREAVE